MMKVYNTIEAGRGCGFRQEGGFYMVFGGRPAPCGYLPVDVPWSINTSRGPQWTKGEWIVMEWEQSVEERVDTEGFVEWVPFERFTGARRQCGLPHCRGCWISKMEPQDPALLIWVGQTYYASVSHFMNEAEEIGVSRRIPSTMVNNLIDFAKRTGKLPPCFLAMREAKYEVLPSGEIVGERKVFCGFIPSNVEYVVDKEKWAAKDPEYMAYLEELDKLGVRLINVVGQIGTQMEMFEDGDEGRINSGGSKEIDLDFSSN